MARGVYTQETSALDALCCLCELSVCNRPGEAAGLVSILLVKLDTYERKKQGSEREIVRQDVTLPGRAGQGSVRADDGWMDR